MPKLKPLTDFILIRPAEPETVSKGGIVIPDSAKQKTTRGEVLAVGPGRPESMQFDDEEETWFAVRYPMGVKVGDVVLYSPYAGQRIEEDGVELVLMKEGEILAVAERAAK